VRNVGWKCKENKGTMKEAKKGRKGKGRKKEIRNKESKEDTRNGRTEGMNLGREAEEINKPRMNETNKELDKIDSALFHIVHFIESN
jgi:hypothetical protein